MRRRTIFFGGLVLVLGFSALWHGPLGAGEELAARAEAAARVTLDRYEMPMIQARMERRPLSRRLVLSGPADEFQRGELVRILDETPGVLDVIWDPASLPQEERAGQ